MRSCRISSLAALVCACFLGFRCLSSSGISAPLFDFAGGGSFPGRCGGAAIDGTNVLVGTYSESRAISSQLVGANLAANGFNGLLSRVDTGRTGSPPVVSFNGTNFLMAWLEGNSPSTELYGQLISRSGTAIGNPFAIMTGLPADNLSSMSWDGQTFLTVWSGFANSTSNIFAQVLLPDGSPSGSPLQISSIGFDAPYAAAAPGTNHLVAWTESTGESNQWRIKIRSVRDDASLSDITDITETPTRSANPLALARGGSSLLTVYNREVGPDVDHQICNPAAIWVTNNWLMLFGRILNLDGVPARPEFQITRFRGNQTEPKAAFDGTNYYVAWNDHRFNRNCSTLDQNYTFGQRISGAGDLVDVEWGKWALANSASLLFAGTHFCYVYTQSSYGTVNVNCTFLRNYPDNGTLHSLQPVSQQPGSWQVVLNCDLPHYSKLQVSTNLIDWTFTDAYVVPNQVVSFRDLLPIDNGPRFFRAIDAIEACRSNMHLIDHVKSVWALETKKNTSDTPLDSDLFGPGRYLPTKPVCPSGGIYSLNEVYSRPICTQIGAGHSY